MTLIDPIYRRERSGKYAHFCDEWDDFLIDENDGEFETCCCYPNNPEVIAIKDRHWKNRMGDESDGPLTDLDAAPELGAGD